MLLSRKWLQEFVFLPDSLSSEELRDQMMTSIVEVEALEYQGKQLDHIVIGKVVSAEKHLQADKLQVCQVDIGSETVQIVCGGSNVVSGMKVALAKVGAKVLWHGEGEPVELAPVKIRGVESFGMICASDEIGLGELFPKQDEKEIVDLSGNEAKPGTPLATALKQDDVILHVDNKSLSHRPDLWGHYGVARELAALYRKKLKEVEPQDIEESKDVTLHVDIKEKKLCTRYMGVVVDNVPTVASPAWMQTRLSSVGVRPINAIVDITNYVMMELGQPLHAFDAANVEEKSNTYGVVVRHAKDHESFVALDGKTYTLDKGMLVIANKKKPLALAGVIGAEDSGVTESTTRVVFEAAHFDPSTVRRAGQLLGLRTDASMRFEKNLDPYLPELALRRAIELVKEVYPEATVISEVADLFEKPKAVPEIVVSEALVEKKLGVSIEKKRIVDMLERLGFEVKVKKENICVLVPTWRATKDIATAEDVVEEIARLYGFNEITSTLPTFETVPPAVNAVRSMERKIKSVLAGECHATEVYNYSFVSPQFLDRIGASHETHLELDNPIAKDRPLLRRSLVPNMLINVEENAHRRDSVYLFEIGRTYIPEEPGARVHENSDDLLPKQDTYLGMVYAAKEQETPFFALSEALARIADRCSVELVVESGVSEKPYLHPGRYAVVMHGNVPVGYIAELHPKVQQELGILYRTAVFELNISEITRGTSVKKEYMPLTQYPAITRDIAVVVTKETTHAALYDAMQSVDPLIESVELFDVYEGKGVPEGKKSMAYHVVYRSTEKTLETGEVDTVHKKVVDLLKKTYHADIRS